MRRSRFLDHRSTRFAMRLSVVEGCVSAVMVGFAELYFVADAVRMGASPLEIGLLAGLPLSLGSTGAILGLRLLRWSGRRKRVIVPGVSIQAAVLFVLALLQWFGGGTPTRLITAACGYHFCTQMVGPSWSSWMGDLVPAPIRGRYFSGRTRMVHLTSFLSLLAAGAILHGFEPPRGILEPGQGFAILYAVAGLARVGCASLLASTPEGRGGHAYANAVPLRPSVRAPVDRLVLGSGLVLLFGVYLSSPFFATYMLEQLRFEYVDYTIASAAMVACKVVSMSRWGWALDRFGAVAVYRLAIVLLSLAPLPWLFVSSLGGAIAAQAYSGFSWAAHEVAFFTLVLETTTAETRARTYALHSVSAGLGQVTGSIVGGLVLGLVIDPRILFGISTVARLLAAALLALGLRELFRGARIGRRRLLLRMIGLRPSGGAIHRPILESRDSNDP